MSKTLDRTLEAVVARFIAEIVATVRAATVAEILGRGAAPRRGRGRPRSDEAAEVAATRLRNARAIVAYLKGHPGASGRDAKRALGLTRPAWLAAVGHGIDIGIVRKRGVKARSRYWAMRE
jgi:hypothetical protein